MLNTASPVVSMQICYTTESRINDSELQRNRNEFFDLSPTDDESRIYNEISEAFESMAENIRAMCLR
jgi:hypothetical protein